METNAERRKRKLAVLATEHGGLEVIAQRAELSAESLVQVVKGTLLPPKRGSTDRSPRALGDSAARAIEGAFNLGRGWFDNDPGPDEMTARELLMLGYFRLLDENMQTLVIENVREASERRAALAESFAAALRRQPAALPDAPPVAAPPGLA
jgi:hypothetical protein